MIPKEATVHRVRLSGGRMEFEDLDVWKRAARLSANM
jgi:hypothetical protein